MSRRLSAPATPAVQPAPPRQEDAADSPHHPSLPDPFAAPSQAGREAEGWTTATPPELNGGLVVYEHGKVVFRMGPSEKEVSRQGRARGGVRQMRFNKRQREKMTARRRRRQFLLRRRTVICCSGWSPSIRKRPDNSTFRVP